jgi:hypothetical protein
MIITKTLGIVKKCCTFAVRINDRGVEQLVARWAHNPKVAGSSPVPATKKAFKTMVLKAFFMID